MPQDPSSKDQSPKASSPQDPAAATVSRVYDYPLMIQESHLDTFGHVNNAIYLQIFEQARWDIITEGGYGLKQVHELQIGPTVLDIHLQFKRELKLRENVLIRSQVTTVSRKTMTMRQVILKHANSPEQVEACIADFVIGLFDLKSRRLIEPTAHWLKAIGVG